VVTWINAQSHRIGRYDKFIKKHYGHVEVAVLNVDFLPNRIDTVVIGDRLFPLPIPVEGRDDEAPHVGHMDVDDGNSDAGQGEEKKDDESSEGKTGQIKEKMQKEAGSTQHISSSCNGKQVEKETATQTEGIGSAAKNPDIPPRLEFRNGNSDLNFSQEIHDVHSTFELTNKSYIMASSSAYPSIVTKLTPQKKDEGDIGKKIILEELEGFSPKPTKRSKRRENSDDEDSCARAERLKTKRNLDGSGTKSFLSSSDSQIALNISNLGVHLGDNEDKNIENIKLLEHNRLAEASKMDQKQINITHTQEEDDAISDKDSDLGLDHDTIQHLVGDITKDVFGDDGSLWRDFKPKPRKNKSGSNK
jgi:hypothetical protein